MKAALISQGSISSQWTLEAMKKYFDEVEDVQVRDIEINLGAKEPVIYKGTALGDYDCIYAKGSFRYAQVLRSIASTVTKKTFTPIGYGAFTLGHDKLLTHQQLQMAGVPMPATYIAATVEAAKKTLKNINYPIIFKFPQGTQGKGVMFAESFASATSILDALHALNQPFIIQEYIETEGSDIRAFVVGNKVVAAMVRKAADGDKRSNLHAGGLGEPIVLDSYMKKIAVQAAKSLDANICGVDMLMSPSGPKVIEVNLSPGLQGITKSTGVDVADKIAKYLFEETSKIVNTQKVSETKKILKDSGINDISDKKEIISTLDFRANRILLPSLITDITGFDSDTEMHIQAGRGTLQIKKFM